MSNKNFSFLMLTGPPGCGKTTLIKKVCDILKEKKIKLNGFFTEEIRRGKERIGFDVVLLDGRRAPLARLKSESCNKFCVGKYAVDVTSFESCVLPLLTFHEKSSILILDEIGKMELLSKKFSEAIKKLISKKDTIILATLPVKAPNSITLVETIRNHSNTILLTVNKENRDFLHQEILNLILETQSKTEKAVS